MKIYAVTSEKYGGYRIIALTADKERANRIAKIYQARVEEHEDAKKLPEWPMWVYCPWWRGGKTMLLLPQDPPESERVEKDEQGRLWVYVRAEDELHARQKGQMIAQHINGRASIAQIRINGCANVAQKPHGSTLTCSNGEGMTVRPDGVHELSPHAYKLTQRLRNVTVEVLTCETCGDVSVAWYRQDDTEEVDE